MKTAGTEPSRHDIHEKTAGTEPGRYNIHEVCCLPISAALEFFERIELSATGRIIAEEPLKEIRNRLRFLVDVGLDYLTLDRAAPTLAGGESQRIRLASQIGSGLVGVLYVLDEPSVGLHSRDQRRLLDSLKRLRDLGNTVIVVEHDRDTMEAADYIVDFGPGPGVRGGQVVAEGRIGDLAAAAESLTGAYLSGREAIEVPRSRRPISRGGTRKAADSPPSGTGLVSENARRGAGGRGSRRASAGRKARDQASRPI